MKITIHSPVGFNETGGRSNNEDTIHPQVGEALASDRLFLVCDGVGGEHRGEVASALACQSLSHFTAQFKGAEMTLEVVKQALDYTLQAFERLEKSDPETHGMATTMTLLYIQDNGIVLAHLGDSRIYQLRQGKIIFKSKDHKWVNELIESGVITEEQAREHPKRNVITRVISAGRNDEPEFVLISDVKADDYFFMCTDGVLEQLYDELLEYHLRDNPDNQSSPSEIIQAIKEECEGKTNDNFSAYLLKIAHVEIGAAPLQNPGQKEVPLPPENKSPTQVVEEKGPQSSSNRFWIMMAAVLLVGTGYYFWEKEPVQTDVSVPVKVSSTAVPTTDTTRPGIEKPKKKEEKRIPGPQKVKSGVPLRKKKDPDRVKKEVDDLRTRTLEEEVKPESETPVPDPVVKSEKSDLPDKLKKVDPKQD